MISGLEFIALEVLDKDNPVLEVLPKNIRWLDGFFQTAMTRTSGFAVFSISSLRIGIQALYLAMMFVSAYPIVIAMRSSNVYEERSLGIYTHKTEARNANNALLGDSGTSPDNALYLPGYLGVGLLSQGFGAFSRLWLLDP